MRNRGSSALPVAERGTETEFEPPRRGAGPAAATAMLSAGVQKENLLLRRLPAHERNAIVRASQTSYYDAGAILLQANEEAEYVYFPIDSVVSMVRPVRDNAGLEVGLIGSEGVVGVATFMHARRQRDSAIVQAPGHALRITSEELRKQFGRGGLLQKYLLGFMHVLFDQVVQNAVCRAFHPLHARVARWMLMVQDRSGVPLIHPGAEAMALMLAADQSRVQTVLNALITARVLRQRRDAIEITDREGLELSSCDCYDTAQQEDERALRFLQKS